MNHQAAQPDMDEPERFHHKGGREEPRLRKDGARYPEFVTASPCFDRFPPPAARVPDSRAGSGAHAFALSDKSHAVSTADLALCNVRIMRAKKACRGKPSPAESRARP